MTEVDGVGSSGHYCIIIPRNLTTDRGSLVSAVVTAPAEPRGTADAEEAHPARPRQGMYETKLTLLIGNETNANSYGYS